MMTDDSMKTACNEVTADSMMTATVMAGGDEDGGRLTATTHTISLQLNCEHCQSVEDQLTRQ